MHGAKNIKRNVIRKLAVNVKGTLEYHTAQVIGYVDDVCLLVRNVRTVKEVYQELKEAPIEIGLHINTSKIKAMIMPCSKINIDQSLNIFSHNIELVNSCIYLGSHIMDDNNKLPKIQRRLILANNAYYMLITVMKILLVHKFVKIRLYKTLIDMVLKYGCDTWKVSKKRENFQNSFKRQISGSVRENVMWIIRYNE